MNRSHPTRNIALRFITPLLVSIALLGAAALEGALSSPIAVRNLRPVIGVFSQETGTITGSSTIDAEVKAELSAYRYMLPASYVNWVGQAGGRVLPILLNQPAGYYDEVFEQQTGFSFLAAIRGSIRRTSTQRRGKSSGIWPKKRTIAETTTHMGTCLVFEELSVLETGDGDVISLDVVATNLHCPCGLPAVQSRAGFSSRFPQNS